MWVLDANLTAALTRPSTRLMPLTARLTGGGGRGTPVASAPLSGFGFCWWAVGEQPPRLLERLWVGGHSEAGGQGLVVVQQRRCYSEVETARNGSAHRDSARERATPTHRMGCLGRILRRSFGIETFSCGSKIRAQGN
jgi:hypothetical protein